VAVPLERGAGRRVKTLSRLEKASKKSDERSNCLCETGEIRLVESFVVDDRVDLLVATREVSVGRLVELD
jgi:hypothetical protein